VFGCSTKWNSAIAGKQREMKEWMAKPVTLETASLDELKKLRTNPTGKTLMINFWATWCGPCRMIAPILEQLSSEYEGKVKVTKLDVDANIKTGSRFNVRSIPTLLFFKGGKVVDQIIGAVPKGHIENKLLQHTAQQHTA